MIRKIFCTIFVALGAFLTANAQLTPSERHSVDTITLLRPAFRLSSVTKLFPVPANYSAKNLGFFCKQEIKMDKKTFIPIRFRLGTLEYCNKMEGKK